MTHGGDILVKVGADVDSFNRDLNRAESRSRGFHKTIMAGAVAAGAALAGLGVAAKIGWGEFSDGAKAAAQTNAVLKSTGGIANVTAKHVNTLSENLMRMSGIDDEAVQAGENMLLTFKNIRNEAGKGNNIFDQTTTALTDMAFAMNNGATPSAEEMNKQAIRLGRALNDPVKGVTALTRVGVQFTEGQKSQIAALVKSGKTMEAQKLILKELNSEFGGSAKAAGQTLPGKLNILKESMTNLAGTIVGKAAPALTNFANAAMTKGLPAIEKFSKGLINAIGPAVEKMAKAFKDAWPGIHSVLDGIGAAIDELRPVFQKLADIGAATMRALGDVMRKHGDDIREIFKNLGEVIKNLSTVVLPVLAFVFQTVLPAALRVVIPVLRVVTEVIAGITGVVANVGAALRAFAGVFTHTLPDAFKTTINWLRNNWPAIATIISGPFAPLAALATNAFGIRSALTGAFGAIKDAAASMVHAIVGFVTSIPDRIASVGAKIANAIKGPINAVIKGWNALRIPGFKVKINMPSPVPDINFGWGGMGLPDIPALAAGGIAMRPTLAMIGERGPEAVVPLGGRGGKGVGGVTLIFNGNIYGRNAQRELLDDMMSAAKQYGYSNPAVGIV
ncbi:MAG: hypothetical protein M0R37_07710 [Bacteroidales bacterium]|nr:hypothetical protein [Bacteroidales bacterium]